MKIYTKTGDQGETSLVGGMRIGKDDLRLETYGSADELNAFVGLLRAKQLPEDMTKVLHFIQNKLFNLGAILASESPEEMLGDSGMLIAENDVHYLEESIDRFSEGLPKRHAFVLPAGSEKVALCHVCRTITRRLERRMVTLRNREGVTGKTDFCLQFVNRMSDLFFILSQIVAQIDESENFFWEKQ